MLPLLSPSGSQLPVRCPGGWTIRRSRNARAALHCTAKSAALHCEVCCAGRFSVYNLTAEFFVGNSEELTEFVPLRKFDLIWCVPTRRAVRFF